jgi:hypothetical protein
MSLVLLALRGNWHKPLPNEPLIPPGWEDVFKAVAGVNPIAGKHCSIIVNCKQVKFEDVATDEVVEAASTFDVSKCVELIMKKLMFLPEHALELDSLPQQVAVAVVLSRYEAVKALVVGEETTQSGRLRLPPLELLRTVYFTPQRGTLELRFTVDMGVWRLLNTAATFHDLKPEDGLAILQGDREKQAELEAFLKAWACAEA